MASSFPALGITTPKFDSPLTTLGQLANLRSQQTENMLRQQQISASQQQQDLIAQETAQKQRDVRDQNTVQSLVKNPANAADFGAGKLDFLTGQISPEYQNKLQEGVSKAHKEKSLASVEDLKLDSQHLQDATDSLFGINQIYAKDPVAGAAAYTSARQLLIDKGNRYAMKAPAEIHSADELQAAEAGLGMTAGITSKALALKEAQAKNDLTAAQSTDAAAKARESGVKADKDQFDLDLMKGATNGSQDAAIDQRFAGNPDAAQAAKDAFRSNIPAGVKAATDAVNKVYEDRVGEAAKAKSLVPGKVAEQAALLPGQVREAGARASAEIGPHIAQAVGTQKALAAQSPDAFAGIVDSSARHSAENELDKTAKDYTDKLGASQQLLDTIHAAQAGNKAAPGVIPIEQVRSVLSNGRVNQAELRGVSSQAGSLMDRIEGWVNKSTKGEPIPPDILRDTASLATIQQQAARRGYDAGIQRLKTRGVDVSKIAAPTISGGGGNIRARDPQGKLHEAPAGTALPAGWKLEP